MNPEEFNPLENNLECSIPFLYPQDESTPSGSLDTLSGEVIQRILAYILPSRNPRLNLAALYYATGHDVGFILGVENTKADISRKLGIPIGTFDSAVDLVCDQFHIQHLNTGNNHESKINHKKCNFRLPKSS